MLDLKLRNALNDPRVELFFIPSAQLRQIVSQGEHPSVAKLKKEAKADLLSGYGIVIDPQMVIDYLDGTLDERMSFILKNSEIRVLGAEEVVFNLKDNNLQQLKIK